MKIKLNMLKIQLKWKKLNVNKSKNYQKSSGHESTKKHLNPPIFGRDF